MTPPSYFAPHGGHPDQKTLLSDRAVFTEAYAVLPRGTMRDIVTSFLRSGRVRGCGSSRGR